jgi:hypothetical protein
MNSEVKINADLKGSLGDLVSEYGIYVILALIFGMILWYVVRKFLDLIDHISTKWMKDSIIVIGIIFVLGIIFWFGWYFFNNFKPTPKTTKSAEVSSIVPSMSVYVWGESTEKPIPNAVISMRRANGDSAPLFNGSQPQYDFRDNYYVYKSLLGSPGEKVIISVSADGYKDDEDPYGLGETAKFPLKKIFE